MQDLDLENYNAIDLDCAYVDDDDDSFGQVIIDKKQNFPNAYNDVNNTDEVATEGNDGRVLQTHTGIKIDLSDDDITTIPEEKPMRTISAEFNDFGGIDINGMSQPNAEGCNQIDMECDYVDDEDDYIPSTKMKEFDFGDDEDEEYIQFEKHVNGNNFKSKKDYNDYMDEIRFQAKELVDEDVLEEKKKKEKVTQGEVEADYWKKLAKQHEKTNVKGSYNTHFHLAGDPKREMELFNQDMKPQGPIPTSPIAADGGVGLMSTGAASSSESSVGAAGGEGGMGEAIKTPTPKKTGYKKLYEDLLGILGFEVQPLKDGSYKVCDTLNAIPIRKCVNKDELKACLDPYIRDCFIYPLQIKTNQNYDEYNDWCNWYDECGKQDYPECEEDIMYCDLLANHWGEIYDN